MPFSPTTTARAASTQPGDLLDLVLAATSDGIMDWDLTTGEIQYSERWKSLLGYEDHELVNSPHLWMDLTHPDDLADAEALLRDHIENLWPFAHTWRMRHKNGDWRWALCRAATVHGHAGVPLRCLSVFTDVTDQVLAEKRLAELTRRNDLLLSSAAEGFLGIDETAAVTFANPAAGEILGCDNAQLVGTQISQALPHGCGTDQPCQPTTCPILKPFTDGGVNRVANVRVPRKDGRIFTADYVSTPAREEGRVVGLVVTFRDVTEQRRMESQLMQGQKMEAIGQLAAGIAHEINTPLQYIGDNVSFLGESFGDLLRVMGEYRAIVGRLKGDPQYGLLVEEASVAEDRADVAFLESRTPEASSSALEGIARVRKIICALKEFSHPGTSEKASADLNHAIESTITVAASTWKHVATVETGLDPTLPPVECHVSEINQVVLNLVVNAAHAIAAVVKSTPQAPHGIIRVETGVVEDHVEIRVSDNGSGIPENIRHRLFEPFFTTKAVGHGTGQGLMLARSIVVDRHHGSISFSSEAGKGTTFVVRLPIKHRG